MSAPDTNLERQTKRHKPALAAIAVAIAAAAVIFVAVTGWQGEALDETPVVSAPATQ